MSAFQDLQDGIKSHLDNSAVLNAAGVKVHTRKSGSIQSKIAEALGRIGLSVFVLPVMPTRANRGLPGPYYPEVQIQVLSYESPVTNKTDLSAYDLADEVEARLHRWDPEIPLVGRVFIDERPRIDDSTSQLFIFRSVFGASINKA